MFDITVLQLDKSPGVNITGQLDVPAPGIAAGFTHVNNPGTEALESVNIELFSGDGYVIFKDTGFCRISGVALLTVILMFDITVLQLDKSPGVNITGQIDVPAPGIAAGFTHVNDPGTEALESVNIELLSVAGYVIFKDTGFCRISGVALLTVISILIKTILQLFKSAGVNIIG